MPTSEFDQSCEFLDALAEAMQRYGVSSRAMETTLTDTARALDLRGEFQATPTQVQSILWRREGGRQRLHIAVSSAGNFDLTKMVDIYGVANQVASGKLSPSEGSARLLAIEQADARYAAWHDALAFVLCGLSFGVILGLSWRDVALAGALSLVPFGVNSLATQTPRLMPAVELVAAMMSAAIAALLCLLFPGSNSLAVTVCAIVYFVPGFGSTLAASELMVGNTLAGLIGFTRAAVTTVKLVAGGLIGGALVSGYAKIPPADHTNGVAHEWTWLFAPMLVTSLAMLFRVRPADLKWSVACGLLVWACLELGGTFGFWQGTFLAAFVLSFASRIFNARTELPPSIILLPSVMLLVPGVAGLRAFYVMQTEGWVEGSAALYQVVILVAAILGGLLASDALSTVRTVRTISEGRAAR